MKLYRQYDAMDCGPTCLRMVASHYGIHYSLEDIRSKSSINREGVSLLGISDAAESIGFRTIGVKLPYIKLVEDAVLPCILHWNQNHFVVLYKVKGNQLWIADPIGQKVRLSKNEFLRSWLSDNSNENSRGVALLIEPTPKFYEKDSLNGSIRKSSLKYLFSYFRQYKKFISQLLVGLLVGSLIQLIFPFLTQSIVDVGINTRDVGFIYLILAGQLMLFLSGTAVEFIRQWILLHLSTRINISIISDFLIKLMQLPLSFFDTKMIGDILQRVEDHSRVQNFLSSSSLNILFSFFNILIFGIVLLFYHIPIFLIFFVGSSFYLGYVILFLKKRRELDYRRFNQESSNQSSLIHLINGISEIKLNGAEKFKRWEWERIQAKLFKVNIDSTRLLQLQESGGLFINEFKNILITFVAATAVIHGEMTLGMMLASQYIIGQLNAPINELITFIRQWQDAKISMERIGEIHSIESEENNTPKSLIIPNEGSIKIDNLTFNYNGAITSALDNISLEIRKGSVTALVGTSGSGKTTLMKLLLKVYKSTSGSISIGNVSLDRLNTRGWRSKCGVVMQDGHIFSDTVAKNVALKDEFPNFEKVANACKVANIHTFIEGLPLDYSTKIGQDGIGLSQGQKQRILIARAIYKDPEYLFFDEATSSLDANNEKSIMHNLNQFFQGRTVLVIAHRLSTVKNADKIVVLENGKLIETGNHQDLVDQNGNYFELVKNQLDLGA